MANPPFNLTSSRVTGSNKAQSIAYFSSIPIRPRPAINFQLSSQWSLGSLFPLPYNVGWYGFELHVHQSPAYHVELEPQQGNGKFLRQSLAVKQRPGVFGRLPKPLALPEKQSRQLGPSTIARRIEWMAFGDNPVAANSSKTSPGRITYTAQNSATRSVAIIDIILSKRC